MEKFLGTRLLPIFILILAVCIAYTVIFTGPGTQRKEPSTSVPVVGVIPLERDDYDINVEAFGTVLPAKQVTLVPEVSGRIVFVNPDLEPGGILKKGNVIVQIYKSDYELALERAQANLKEAEAALALEKGHQVVAKREWETFGSEIDSNFESSALALREPQLAQAEANVAVARIEIEEAKLNLERTTLLVPFDAIVIEEFVEVGQRIGPETQIVKLAGVDQFWVMASVPFDRFQHIHPSNSSEGSMVEISLDTGLGGTIKRCGRVTRKLGNLDSEGRMGRVLISIDDPLSLKTENSEGIIPLDSYVRLEVFAGRVNDVYRIPRQGLRENNQVWVSDSESKLRIRDVGIVWRYRDLLYVRGEFQEKDRLITTHLGSVVPGMDVTVRQEREEHSEGCIAVHDTEDECE